MVRKATNLLLGGIGALACLVFGHYLWHFLDWLYELIIEDAGWFGIAGTFIVGMVITLAAQKWIWR